MSNADRLNVSPDSLERAGRIAALLRADFGLGSGRRLVVGVAGESGSGKSVAATSLARALEADGVVARVLYQDDFFVRPPRTNHEFRQRDPEAHVGPQEVRLEAIAAQVDAFRAGRDGVEGPLVDYPGNRFGTQVHDYAAAQVLVVEGTYVLGLAGLDVRLFHSATYRDTHARRIARGRDADDPFVERVLAIEHRLIAPQAAVADLVVDRDFVMHRR